jgi:hypothetical protein
MPDRDIADLQARTKILEESHEKVELRIESKIDGLVTSHNDLKTLVVTAIATARVKWKILFSIAAIVGAVAAIVATLVKFVFMK